MKSSNLQAIALSTVIVGLAGCSSPKPKPAETREATPPSAVVQTPGWAVASPAAIQLPAGGGAGLSAPPFTAQDQGGGSVATRNAEFDAPCRPNNGIWLCP